LPSTPCGAGCDGKAMARGLGPGGASRLPYTNLGIIG
jgi:hypothetical protein